MPENIPASHMSHESDPKLEYVPELQRKHWPLVVAPRIKDQVPALQKMHVEEPAEAHVPVPHVTH